VDVLIAGGRNMYTALKARIPFLDINQEREFGYAGYTGMLELARQLVLTIESPIWPAVRQPAPWVSQEPLSSGQRKPDERAAKDGRAGRDSISGVAPGMATLDLQVN
jgi:nitrogenase molybdenum-cofactor synthesis protein NifE